MKEFMWVWLQVHWCRSKSEAQIYRSNYQINMITVGFFFSVASDKINENVSFKTSRCRNRKKENTASLMFHCYSKFIKHERAKAFILITIRMQEEKSLNNMLVKLATVSSVVGAIPGTWLLCLFIGWECNISCGYDDCCGNRENIGV